MSELKEPGKDANGETAAARLSEPSRLVEEAPAPAVDAPEDAGEPRQVDNDDDDDASDAGSILSTDDCNGSFESGLLEALDGIRTPGSFASFHPLKHLDPELVVRGVGAIGLPLSEPQVRQMIGKAVQAPFGKGSETIVDTTVRNTWELDPKNFELRNPRWAAHLHKICSVVASDLGIQSPVGAELYKLLIYEEGAMFKAHTDTEKCPGMFGTLVVCLPSAHEGGDVVVRHCGEKKTFKTSGATQSFACWYSDVSHEVLPVTHGYRVVLTYNLAHEPGVERPSAGLQKTQVRKLRHKLRRWLKGGLDGGELDHVYYGLDHEYTEASVSSKALKGRDEAVVQTLHSLASRLDFDVLLALTEKMEMGSPVGGDYERHHYNRQGRRGYGRDEDYSDEFLGEAEVHDIDEVHMEHRLVKVLVDLNGRPILRDVALDQARCLQGKEFFDAGFCEEDYEGCFVQGPTATHWYRVTAVLLVRRDRMTSFLKNCLGPDTEQSHGSIKLLILYLADSIVRQEPNQMSAFDTLQDIWSMSVARAGGIALKSDVVARVLQAAIQLEQWEFFDNFAGSIRGAVPTDFYEWLGKQVAEAKVSFSKIKTSLARMILKCKYFFEQEARIKQFAPNDAPLPDEIREWARDTLARGLAASSASASFVGHDGFRAVSSARGYADFEWLSSTVVPLIENHLDAPAFGLEFLSGLVQLARNEVFPMKEAMQLHKRLAKSFISKLDFSKVYGPRPEQQTPPSKSARLTHRQDGPGYTDRCSAVSPQALCSLFRDLFSPGPSPQEDLAMPLAIKLVGHAPQMQAADFPCLWLPFLRELVAVLETQGVPLTTPRYQQVFGAVLDSYRDNYVGRKPARPAAGPASGTYLQNHCSCADCRQLDGFLADPRQESCRFPVSKSRRHHLHQQIDAFGIDCSHVSDRTCGRDTLVVTKRGRSDDARWEARRNEAADAFQAFDQTKLGLLLGEDYPALAEALWKRPASLAAAASVPVPIDNARIPVVNRAPEPMTRHASGSRGSSLSGTRSTGPAPPAPAPAPVAGRKRKPEPEFIDLT